MNPKPIVVVMIVLLFVGASACAPEPEPLPSPPPTVLPTVQPSPTTPPMEALDPTGYEVHLWHAFTGQKEATLLNLAAKFEADNAYSITLRVEYHNPLPQEVLTAISAGTPPDVVIAPCDQIAEYAALNAVAPLTPYLENAKHGLGTEQSDLWPIVLSGCAGTQPKGSWGLSFDLQAAVMFYNAAWLKKIKAATPQNWTDFRKLCNTVRDKKAATWGYAGTTDGLTLVNWISGLGGVLFDSHEGQVTLDDPQAVAALGVLRDLLQDGCAYCSSAPGADRADFAAEKVLFTFGSTADLAKYTGAIYNTKTKKNKFAWEIAPVPGLQGEPVVTVQGPVMSMLRTTPRQQLAAWLFLKWFVQRENDVQWALETGALPLHKSSIEAPEMEAYLEQNPQYKTACGLLALAATEPAIPRWQEIRALLVNAAEAVCLGQAEPQDALAAADTAADGLLAR
jgi:ABC-type glycerol-3-phosphate transport system substrate-binding protein